MIPQYNKTPASRWERLQLWLDKHWRLVLMSLLAIIAAIIGWSLHLGRFWWVQ